MEDSLPTALVHNTAKCHQISPWPKFHRLGILGCRQEGSKHDDHAHDLYGKKNIIVSRSHNREESCYKYLGYVIGLGRLGRVMRSPKIYPHTMMCGVLVNDPKRSGRANNCTEY